jgi:hypothetical protein
MATVMNVTCVALHQSSGPGTMRIIHHGDLHTRQDPMIVAERVSCRAADHAGVSRDLGMDPTLAKCMQQNLQAVSLGR